MNGDFFKYLEIAPHSALKEVVVHYRIKEAKLSTPLVFPNYSPIFQGLVFNIQPWDNIIFNKNVDITLRHKVHYVGQALSPGMLSSSSVNINTIAVHLTPTGIHDLTGICPADFIDKIVDAEHLFGATINELYEKVMTARNVSDRVHLINEYLKNILRKRVHKRDTLISKAVELLSIHSCDMNIQQLHRKTFSGARTMERNFKNVTGMTPKVFHRLVRFNCTKRHIENMPYYDGLNVAIRFGYYDQSHMINEFRKFAGTTPRQYIEVLHFGH